MFKSKGRFFRTSIFELLGKIYIGCFALFIIAPILIIFVISFNKGQYFIFPPTEYSLRWYKEIFIRTEWRQAFFVSLQIAVITTIISTVVGLMASLALGRGQHRGQKLLTSFFVSPLILPQLLLGLALLFLLAKLGLLGSVVALVVGHVLITFPVVLRIVLSSLGSVPASVEDAALTLGADELKTTLLITIPIIRPAIISGSVFAFVRSYDNVLISLFLSSGKNITLPVKILSVLQETSDPSIAAISSIFVIISLILLFVIDRIWGVQFIQEDIVQSRSA